MAYDKARDVERVRQWRQKNPAKYLCNSARCRAMKQGAVFSLTPADIVVPTHCPILGIPLEQRTGTKGPGPASPTLDRINPDWGYVPGNVQVMSSLANQMKSSATPGQLAAFARWVTKIYPELVAGD